MIKEINRHPIESLVDYKKAMSAIGEDENLLLLVRRGKNTYYVVVSAD